MLEKKRERESTGKSRVATIDEYLRLCVHVLSGLD